MNLAQICRINNAVSVKADFFLVNSIMIVLVLITDKQLLLSLIMKCVLYVLIIKVTAACNQRLHSQFWLTGHKGKDRM